MHGLIIREPWMGYILTGTKTWEMRTTPAPRRGRIALIRKGTGLVVGTAELVDSLAPLDAASLAASRDRHRIPAGLDSEVIAAGWLHPWVLHDVRVLAQPVPAGQKPGQVIWVPLAEATAAAIDAQTGTATSRIPKAAASPVVMASVPMPARVPDRPPGAVRPAPAPIPAPPGIGGSHDEVIVVLTDGAIRNSNLSVRTARHLLPDDVLGGSNRDTVAAGRLTVVFEPGETVETDIAADKMLLRCRGAVADFFVQSGATPGDRVCMYRDDVGALRVQIARR
ncbi:MAG: hypothetical protein JWP59_4766 [Massilia sp.]|nr:hypothetical protein [Massilia sp.]